MIAELNHSKHLKAKLVKDIIPFAFWSYDSIKPAEISDESLIEAVLISGNRNMRMRLLDLYNRKKIQQVWEDRLIPRDVHFRELNRNIASELLNIPNPDSFIKSSYKKNNFYERFSA